MKHAFLLSGENIDIAKEEIISLFCVKEYKLEKNILIAYATKPDLKRLSYTHTVYEYLFSSKKKDFLIGVNRFNWEAVFSENFCVRIHGKSEFMEKELAGYIWRNLKNPKVNLTNPKTRFDFYFIGRNALCLKFLMDNDKAFLKRRAHLRPKLHPSSLNPRLARAMINLTGIKKGKLYDPFCGTGGILIEGGLLGYEIIGNDIEEDMILRTKENLEHFGINSFNIAKKDSNHITEKSNLIVTDLPYGKSTKALNLKKLYFNFLNSSVGTTKAMAVGFPDFANGKKIISKTKWKIKHFFKVYAHKNLTRHIFILG
ncbi:MAG: DNA methyltransferase [archaeon]